MKVIYKYPLTFSLRQKIEMPVGATPLDIQLQDNTLCMWAEVDPNEVVMRPVEVLRVNTGGESVPERMYYLSTVQVGVFVFHFYVASTVGAA